MRIKNTEKHKYNKGKIRVVERDNEKRKRKDKIKEARKNKKIIQDFENLNINQYLEEGDEFQNLKISKK